MRLLTLVSLLGLISALLSCRRQETDPEVIVNLPAEYTIDLFEQRDAANGYPTFGFWVETVEVCPCSPCSIDAVVKTTPGNIAVNILGTTEPTGCTGPAKRAQQFVPIGNLPEGVYALSIALGQSGIVVSQGTLSVQPGRYVLDLPEPKGIQIGQYVLQHIPDHYLWGFAAAADSAGRQHALNFLRDLKQQTLDPDLAPGFYGYFTISGTGVLTLYRPLAPEQGIFEPFVRKLPAAVSELRPLVKQYRDASAAPTIRLLSTEGEI